MRSKAHGWAIAPCAATTFVQARIWLTRSFDERSHSYLGYKPRLVGHVGDASREFTLGIGKAAQAKLQAENEAAGLCEPSVVRLRLEEDVFFAPGMRVAAVRAPRTIVLESE